MLFVPKLRFIGDYTVKIKKGDVCFAAWRRLQEFKVKLKVSWREKNSILDLLGAEHLVFSREKHTSCWTGDKNRAFCHTHLAGGPYLHTLVRFPPHPLFILAAIIGSLTPLPSLISSISLPQLPFPFFFSPVSLSLSLCIPLSSSPRML